MLATAVVSAYGGAERIFETTDDSKRDEIDQKRARKHASSIWSALYFDKVSAFSGEALVLPV
jgi:hypothetical protein